MMLRALVMVVCAIALAAYFGQHLTLPPNATEGGTMLTYVEKVASGRRLYFDFFDYYGPVAWSVPAMFFEAAGHAEIGVRVYLLLVKIASVAAAYFLTRRLTDSFYATLAAVCTSALLGQLWPFFQIPYAPHLASPLVFTVWLLLLGDARRPSKATIVAAGVLTAVIACIKSSTGAFVFAGGLYYLAYLRPVASPTATALPDGSSLQSRSADRFFQLAGLLAYGAVFHGFMMAHAGWRHVAYLSIPLAIALVWTARRLLVEDPASPALRERLRGSAIYAAATALGGACILLYYFQWNALAYLTEQWRVLSTLTYAVPFPPLFTRGTFGAFNLFWPVVPWLGTLALLLCATAPRAEGLDGPALGLFVCCTLHAFVIYPRADEAHLFYAVLAATPSLLVLLHRVESSFHLRRWTVPHFRVALAFGSLVAVAPIFSMPTADDYELGSSVWGSPRFRHLRYYPADYPLQLEGRASADWDRDLDAAARRVMALTDPGEPVLVVGLTQLLNFASYTEPIGGRYGHFFYLLRANVLDRAGFLKLVPSDLLADLYADPPRVVVYDGERTLLERLPELDKALKKGRYEMVGKWSVLRVYVRKDTPTARP